MDGCIVGHTCSNTMKLNFANPAIQTLIRVSAGH